MFPDDRMIPFNAFGRILTRNDASETLKALASRLAPGAGKHNIQFDMKWATVDLHEKRQAQMLRSILWHLGPSEADCRKVRKDKIYAMKVHLDEDSTAALVMAVLGVASAQRKKWHRAIVEAIEAGPPGPRGLFVKHACALGVLKHAPAAAAKYEREILARYDGHVANKPDGLLDHKQKGEFVAAMIRLCGPSCLVTTRMYLLLPFGSDKRVVPPRAMSVVLSGYPALFELDFQYTKNRAIGAKKSWVEKVRAARVSLWGADAESDVCVGTVIALTETRVLCSVLARID
jgi:hypothetical protein